MLIAFGGLGSTTMEFMLVVGLFWVVFLLLLGLTLWAIRKCKNNRFRIWGQVLAILLFAAVFAMSHCFITRAIAEAIAVVMYH